MKKYDMNIYDMCVVGLGLGKPLGSPQSGGFGGGCDFGIERGRRAQQASMARAQQLGGGIFNLNNQMFQAAREEMPIKTEEPKKLNDLINVIEGTCEEVK